jgi:hypothetical protein
MARILLRVRVLAITPFYPQVWLFEPFFCLRHGTALLSPATALHLQEDVKLGGDGRMGWVGKKRRALASLNPDYPGVYSATLSYEESLKTMAFARLDKGEWGRELKHVVVSGKKRQSAYNSLCRVPLP